VEVVNCVLRLSFCWLWWGAYQPDVFVLKEGMKFIIQELGGAIQKTLTMAEHVKICQLL
jgi:hypothetical protein